MDYSTPSGLPIAKKTDAATLHVYSPALVAGIEQALSGKAAQPPPGRAYLTYGTSPAGASSPYPCTVWGDASNIQFQVMYPDPDTKRLHPGARFHHNSGTSGHTWWDLMRNDGHGHALPDVNWAALPSVPAYIVATQAGDLVVTPQTGSSRAIKRDIEPLDAELPDVEPVTFRYNHPDDAPVSAADRDRLRVGFIAEDVPAEAQVLDSAGRAVDVDPRSMTALLWAEVLRLRDRVAALEERTG